MELNASDVVCQKDFESRVAAGTFIATLQAGYTDFHYLRQEWRDVTEEDALLGVGVTGIGSNRTAELNLKQAAEVAIQVNKEVAALIGINPAARITTVKPAGTTSLVLGCSSGVHAWHNDYYLRRMRIGKNEALYAYLKENHPELVEDEHFRPEDQAVISIPQKAPEGSILRTEHYNDLLVRVKRWSTDWVRPGSLVGANTHNVSCTISLKDDEWDGCGQWMWENREFYNGISVLNYDGGSYIQAPFEDITKEEYERLSKSLTSIDLSKVKEGSDNTNLSGEAACAGGMCTIEQI